MASTRPKSKKSRNVGHRSGETPEPTLDPSPATAKSEPSRRGRLLAWLGFTAVLLACMGWVVLHAFFVYTVTVRLCDGADRNIPVEKRMPVFLSEIAFDGYLWNRHAEHLGEDGDWRIRHTDFDNAPEGREVHWSSGFAWYLRGLGEIYRARTGDSLRNSIFRMSIWANPILLVLALGIFSTISARRFGPLCGAVIAIGMVAVPTFYEGFMPAYPDHHGIIAFSLLGMVFGIAWAGAGWVQAPGGNDFAPPHSLRQARHGMIFSAICGAAGLWISAFSAAIVAVGIGLAIIVATFVASRRKQEKSASTYHPELWTLWGSATSLAGLALYLLEYFPGHLRLRLEVNHPLYLLAWYAGGVAISCITRWILLPERNFKNFPLRRIILCSLACALIPAALLIGQQKVYALLDPFNVKLLAQIAETLPLLTRIKLGGLTWQMAFGWFPVFLLAAFLMQSSKQTGSGTKVILVFLSIPVLFITAMQFYQVRWGMRAGPLYIALAGIVVPQVWKLVPQRMPHRVLATLILLFFGCLFVEPSLRNSFQLSWAQYKEGEKVSITMGQGLALLHRQMAGTILDDAKGKPVVLLSSPNSSCLLAALGGFKTIGTLYWENIEGLKKAAVGLNAQSDSETLAFLKKHGITHVSLMTWENFIGPFFGILYSKPPPGVSYENSFGKRALFNRVIPPFTRPLIFPPSDLTKGLKQQVLLLAVDPQLSLADAQVHLARFIRIVEGNPVTAEVTLKQLIDNNANSTAARIELAQLFLDQKRFPEMATQVAAAFPTDLEAQNLAKAAEFLKQGQPENAAREAAQAARSSNPTISNTAKNLLNSIKPSP